MVRKVLLVIEDIQFKIYIIHWLRKRVNMRLLCNRKKPKHKRPCGWCETKMKFCWKNDKQYSALNKKIDSLIITVLHAYMFSISYIIRRHEILTRLSAIVDYLDSHYLSIVPDKFSWRSVWFSTYKSMKIRFFSDIKRNIQKKDTIID